METHAQLAESGERRYDLHIFCDFDGTIASVDVGVELFRTFGSVEPWLSLADSGALPIAEYWHSVAGALRKPVALAELDAYLCTVEVDAGFASLLAFARGQDIPFTVVSDGLDLYVGPVLARHDAADVPYFCNHAELDADGAMQVSFPHQSESCCGRFTVSCKRNVVLGNAHPDARIVYIGDGLSDVCPADHADIIFAKGTLAAYCNAERLPHYPFKTLADVERQLRLLLQRRRIRPRHQAALRRKGAWETE